MNPKILVKQKFRWTVIKNRFLNFLFDNYSFWKWFIFEKFSFSKKFQIKKLFLMFQIWNIFIFCKKKQRRKNKNRKKKKQKQTWFGIWKYEKSQIKENKSKLNNKKRKNKTERKKNQKRKPKIVNNWRKNNEVCL